LHRGNRISARKRRLQSLHPGERTNTSGKAVFNNILLSIPDREYDSIRPHLRFVSLPHHRSLHEPNRKLEFAYFPNAGMISLVVTARSGRSVEVGMVGKEGFTPIPIVAGLRRSPHRAVVQIAGDGFQLSAATLQALLHSSPRLQAILNRHVVLQGMQAAQTGGCNRLHDLEQRLARWLLMTQDRVASGLLAITHDFLAMMLGTDRPSVSLAAATLQRKRIIECTYGGVKILNRKRLEATACECYGIIQQFDGEMALR
jgi:CRP-like cAMP-binding protein